VEDAEKADELFSVLMGEKVQPEKSSYLLMRT